MIHSPGNDDNTNTKHLSTRTTWYLQKGDQHREGLLGWPENQPDERSCGTHADLLVAPVARTVPIRAGACPACDGAIRA
jgi:hypothetical protein